MHAGHASGHACRPVQFQSHAAPVMRGSPTCSSSWLLMTPRLWFNLHARMGQAACVQAANLGVRPHACPRHADAVSRLPKRVDSV